MHLLLTRTRIYLQYFTNYTLDIQVERENAHKTTKIQICTISLQKRFNIGWDTLSMDQFSDIHKTIILPIALK